MFVSPIRLGYVSPIVRTSLKGRQLLARALELRGPLLLQNWGPSSQNTNSAYKTIQLLLLRKYIQLVAQGTHLQYHMIANLIMNNINLKQYLYWNVLAVAHIH